MEPYIIHSPYYDHRSGGIRAMYRLHKELLDRDVEARIRNDLDHSEQGVHVWPEVAMVRGENAVSWQLGPRRFTRGDEKVYAWEPWVTGEEDAPQLQVPIVDIEVFRPGTGQRKGCSYYVGKGQGWAHPVENATEITLDWPASRHEMAEHLQRLELLICFDPLTALSLEAVLCGCPVLFLCDPRIAEGHAQNLTGCSGYAYGPDEVDQAREAVKDAYGYYRDWSVPCMQQTIDDFLVTSSYAP